MAIIKCGECGSEVSDKAFACPHCGNPISIEPKPAVSTMLPPQEKIVIKEKKKIISLKRLTKVTIVTIALFVLLIFVFLTTIQISYPAFIQSVIQTIQTPGKIYQPLLEEVSQILGKQQQKTVESIKTNPLSAQTNPNGSRTYPVQYNNLWGHEFYTSKIDQSGNIDIGSSPKQTIAKLLNSLGFPPNLTKNLIIINIDPTIVKPSDQLEIPWLGGKGYSVVLQPEGGIYMGLGGDSSVIFLNNLVGYDLAVLTHELGHVIGHHLTDQEWKQYYKLRGIPSDTPRNSSSPTQDFAEAYKATYKSSVVESSTYEYLYGGWAANTKYGNQVNNSTKQFIKDVVARLNGAK